MTLQHKRIVLGLTGGIACYKSAELLRRLTKAGATVQVVMTDAATHFITTTTMQALSGQPVYTDQWDASLPSHMPHIDLSRNADAIVVAPASTDFLAKLAHGRCDDLLSTLCIARKTPLLVAPAMNCEMWAAAPTQRNVAQLRDDGVTILGPGDGELACGETGPGRMLEPDALFDEIVAFFQPKVLAGQRVLITAGPTFEPLDPVRGLTNRSSGKMGFALAQAAREAGADVTLIAGPTALPTPTGVARIDVETAIQMHDAVLARAAAADVFIAVAAVADWRAAEPAAAKLKKDGAGRAPTFELVANPDILAAVAQLPNGPYCVGFAAESENLAQHGADKRIRKGVPLLVGNLGPATFGRDDNELMLFDDAGATTLPRADKLTLARQLVANLAARVARR